MSKPKRKYIEQDEFCVRLSIWGDDLDPDEITRLLGASPTDAWRKGDVNPWSGFPKLTGSWSIKTERSTGDVEEHLTELVAGLSSHPAVWKALTSRYRADLYCGFFLAGLGHGISMTPKLHRLLADRNLDILFNIYCEYDHDAKHEWRPIEVHPESPGGG